MGERGSGAKNVVTIGLRKSPGNNLTAGNSKSFSKPMKQENAVDQAIVRDLRKGRGKKLGKRRKGRDKTVI